MEALFITPIHVWENAGGIQKEEENKQEYPTEGNLFADVFKNAVDQVKVTQGDVEEKQYLLATGRLDDAHSLPIAEAKAALSVDVLVTLRNKALEAYNDLIKMSV